MSKHRWGHLHANPTQLYLFSSCDLRKQTSALEIDLLIQITNGRGQINSQNHHPSTTYWPSCQLIRYPSSQKEFCGSGGNVDRSPGLSGDLAFSRGRPAGSVLNFCLGLQCVFCYSQYFSTNTQPMALCPDVKTTSVLLLLNYNPAFPAASEASAVTGPTHGSDDVCCQFDLSRKHHQLLEMYITCLVCCLTGVVKLLHKLSMY